MPTSTIYLGLFLACCVYTVALVLWRHLLEPDLTILEVVIGTALCLAAPFLDARFNGPYAWDVYEARVWWAFGVGVIPIGIWQFAQLVYARIRVEARMGAEYDDAPEGATPLADEPGTAPTTHD